MISRRFKTSAQTINFQKTSWIFFKPFVFFLFVRIQFYNPFLTPFFHFFWKWKPGLADLLYSVNDGNFAEDICTLIMLGFQRRWANAGRLDPRKWGLAECGLTSWQTCKNSLRPILPSRSRLNFYRGKVYVRTCEQSNMDIFKATYITKGKFQTPTVF